MSYPRFRRSRAHKMASRATGTAISLNSNAIAELAAATNGPGTGAFDLTLEAQVGDTLEWAFNGIAVGVAGTPTAFDVYTMVSGSRVNPFGAGLSAANASTLGVAGWFVENVARNYPIAGSVLYVVQAGDIASGQVTCRPHYVQTTATAQTLHSEANVPLRMWLKNLGPVSV